MLSAERRKRKTLHADYNCKQEEWVRADDP